MNEYSMKGWIAVDKDAIGRRRVSFFPKEPARDVIGSYHYWAAAPPYFESIQLDSNLFEGIGWEDEPIEAEITVKIKTKKGVEK